MPSCWKAFQPCILSPTQPTYPSHRGFSSGFGIDEDMSYPPRSRHSMDDRDVEILRAGKACYGLEMGQPGGRQWDGELA